MHDAPIQLLNPFSPLSPPNRTALRYPVCLRRMSWNWSRAMWNPPSQQLPGASGSRLTRLGSNIQVSEIKYWTWKDVTTVSIERLLRRQPCPGDFASPSHCYCLRILFCPIPPSWCNGGSSSPMVPTPLPISAMRCAAVSSPSDPIVHSSPMLVVP